MHLYLTSFLECPLVPMLLSAKVINSFSLSRDIPCQALSSPWSWRILVLVLVFVHMCYTKLLRYVIYLQILHSLWQVFIYMPPADFFRQKLNFTGTNSDIAFLCHPLGDLGVTYTVHLWLVGKRVVDFLRTIF